MSHLSKLCRSWVTASCAIGAPTAAADFSGGVAAVRAALRMSCFTPRLALAALMLIAPVGVFAQNNSFATVIQNNSAMQANLTQQMINLNASRSQYSGKSTAPEPCLPPYQLQRGMNGVVPPELQGDPRYQQYLRCRQGQANPQNVPATSVAPSLAGTQHLPITATDFVPALYGHPFVDQAIANMQIAPQERMQLREAVERMFKHVATEYRGNNVAVSVAVAYSTALVTLNGSQLNAQQIREFALGVNDTLARAPQFAQMSPAEKQNNSDSLIFQTAMIIVLRDMGQRDPQAGQQAIALSRVVLQKLGSS
jgi:hypothetical protein